MESPAGNHGSLINQFRKHWQSSTDDNNLTLHGFRRFKTTHLLSLRFLEGEIAELDAVIYQAGLSLGPSPSDKDRLGLKNCKKDPKAPKAEEVITQELVLKLRGLIKEYDEALTAFNSIMAMETFSLLDDEKHSSRTDNFSLYEIYKTRLVRVDLGTRARQDPFQRRLHMYLRAFRYWRLSRRPQDNVEGGGAIRPGRQWSYQNTVLLAEILGRSISTLIAAIFLIVPLTLLSYETSKKVQLITISSFVVTFSSLVSFMLKVSNLEMMVVSATYAAVLSVFVSNISVTVT